MNKKRRKPKAKRRPLQSGPRADHSASPASTALALVPAEDPAAETVPRPTRHTNVRVLDAERVAAAIVKYKGNISAIARQFKVHRSTVQEFIGNRLVLQQILADAKEGQKDDAEVALHKAIRKGMPWAVCFFLKTQARDRGYGDKPLPERSSETRLNIRRVVVLSSGEPGAIRPSSGVLPNAE